ncbi:MAG: hypothetical protein JNL80_05285 [Phycisphaerae bacterium]|nr:hypothetical protein [Phycisphaerae bacterium]
MSHRKQLKRANTEQAAKGEVGAKANGSSPGKVMSEARHAAPHRDAAPNQPGRTFAHGAAPWLIRVASLWLLAGALAKAFSGTPSELPAPILDSDLDPFHVIPAAVVVETVVSLVALVVPRRAWIPLAAALLTFAAILVFHLRSGAEHCGCFGGAFPIPAWIMLAIDGSLAVLVIASAIALRAWPFARAGSNIAIESSHLDHARSIPGRQGSFASLPVLLCAAGVAAVSLGWYTDARLRPIRPVETRTLIVPGPALTDRKEPLSFPVSTPSGTDAPRPWALPEPLPNEVVLRPILWTNKRLAETELGRFTDTSKFPQTATIVIYYESCNHCAAHLRELAEKQKAAGNSESPTYVLVQLPTPKGDNIKIFVDTVPQGMHVAMPEAITRWVITPPWDVFVENGIVKRVERIKWPDER